MEDQEREVSQKFDEIRAFRRMVLTIGFVGGVFWSLLGYLAYYLNFTEIRPNIILELFTLNDLKNFWQGTLLSVFLIGLVSIGVAYIYYGTLRRIFSMWIGLCFGVMLFVIVFIVLNPLFPGIGPVSELERTTLITTICLYILYGIFIGYSISYEEFEIQRQKNGSVTQAGGNN